MRKFEETMWPTADRTKNYILQMMDKGKAEGIAEGKKEGKEEKTYHTVKNMILEGLDTSFICRIAEVTPEYVEKVRHELRE